MPKSTIPWTRVTAEGTAIVLSILLAFAIDAWWDRRGELEEERTFLASLRQEIEVARTDLTTAIEQQTDTRDAGVDWTYVTDSTPTDSVSVLVQRLIFWYTPELDLPSVESALAGGRIARLRTRDLPQWIAKWASDSKDTYEEADAVRSHVLTQYFPFFVAEEVNVTPLFRASGIPLSSRVPEDELRQLIGHDGFESMINFGSLLNAGFVDEATETLELLEEGLRIVDRGLSN